MDTVVSLPLSLRTLLGWSLVPLLFFVYRRRYFYRPDLIRLFDFLLAVAGVIVGTLVVLKSNVARLEGASSDELLVYLLHLTPIATIFVLLAHAGYVRTAGPARSDTTSSAGRTAAPAPHPSRRTAERLGWDDIVIDPGLKTELVSVTELLKDPKTSQRYGIQLPKGILFSGPPGTGKTTIAKVVASTAGLSFFVLKADEVVSKWVGDSEKNLTSLFDAASRHAPSVVFIDEIDSIGKNRTGESAHSDGLLNHLLQLVDGVIRRDGVYVIGATNRPDLVDPALKRAGRLDRVIEIPLPNFEARKQLFALYLSKLSLREEFDLAVLAELTDGKSAADIRAVCNQAGLNAFRRESGQKKRDFQVTQEDMRAALGAYI